MLTDPKAIEIISKAKQKNVSNPNRSRKHFENIFEDFFFDMDFQDLTLMDFGPGHYDFGELSRAKGAIVRCIDKDPAVIELGTYLGYEVYEMDLKKLKASFIAFKHDGVFCKFSLNAFWFSELERLVDHTHQICNLMKDNAWGWIVPWNGIPKGKSLEVESDLDFLNNIFSVQLDTFAEYGFQCYQLDREHSVRYGVTGKTFNTPLFLKNLSIPESLSKLAISPTD